MRRTRRTIALGGLALAAVLLPGCGEPPGPSVLLVTFDTTRADRLGIYGYAKPTSPNLDTLAQGGVVFETALASAANTPVSHASILTGLHPYHHGLRVLHGSQHQLPSRIDTVAEHFRAAGYRTGAFVSAFPLAARFGMDQGFDHYDADFLSGGESAPVLPDGTINTGANQRRADVTTDLALAWLEAGRGPFFLWVHYFDPHDVLLLPPEDFVDPRQVEGIQRDKLLTLYDEEIRFMDREFGRLVEGVAEQADSLVSVVTADHGEGLGDHDWWNHGILYQEQIRIPLVVHGPGAPAGRRVGHPVRGIDIAPTILELAGLAVDGGPTASMDGRSLVPLFAEGAPDPGHVAYSDSFSQMIYMTPTLDPLIVFSDDRNDVLVALVQAGFKYIHHLRRPEESELYHLVNDPGETRNLLTERPEVVARMLAELDARPWRLSPSTGGPALTTEEIQRLESLGYVIDPD